MNVTSQLKKALHGSAKTPAPNPVSKRSSLWTGPGGTGPNGGVTQSLIGRFLSCRERFRLYAVEGLRPPDRFNHRPGYGNMWHVCEEALAATKEHDPGLIAGRQELPWKRALEVYGRKLCDRYPFQREEVEKWYNVCAIQFPLYIDWWSTHQDVKDRTPLLQEKSFDVPYELPSGRTVRLRGKWDSVDLIGKGKDVGVYLQENKTKGDIDEPLMRQQLSSGFDLQTMLYLVALDRAKNYAYADSKCKNPHKMDIGIIYHPIRGVRYNVVRRPLSGGRGTIVQSEGTKGAKCNLKPCKDAIERTGRGVPGCERCRGTGRFGAQLAETDEEFYGRLSDVIQSAVGQEWSMPAGEHYFFMRWKIEITAHDVAKFRCECLDPILEQMYDWYSVKVLGRYPGSNYIPPVHWRYPFGVYNPLAEGGASEYDACLLDDTTAGLRRTGTLFEELESSG